jgi:predicted permease
MLAGLAADVREGLKRFRRAPALPLITIATLGIGIGATTAIFSMLDAATAQRLPVPRPEQLRNVVVVTPQGVTSPNVPAALLDQLRSVPAFSGVFAFWRLTMNVGAGSDVERLAVQAVSGGYYSALGIAPSAGRLIDEADDTGKLRVAVLSHAFWRRQFGGDPAAVGRVIELNGSPTTIVGVAPPAFFGTDRGASPDVTIPLSNVPRLANLWLAVRLKQGVSDDAARTEAERAFNRALEIMRPGLANLRPRDRERILAQRAALLPGDRGLSEALRKYVDPLRLLMLLAAIVLVIACVNLANLLLARSAGRAREMSVRLALGAGRWRLARQTLTEHAMLSAAGTIMGLALAFGLYRVLAALLLDETAVRSMQFSLNSHVLAFAGVAMVSTLALAGVVPALRASGARGVSLLQRSAPAGRGASLPLMKGLIVVQVAGAVLLIFSAGLLVRTFHNLLAIDTGVGVHDLLMMRLGFGQRGYQAAQAADFYDQIEEQLRLIPGVESVSFGWDFAFSSGTSSKSIWVEGLPPDQAQSAAFNVVGPRFFATAGVPVLAGRDFDRADRLGAPKVVVINEAFARRYLPNQNPIGRHVGDEGASSSFKYEIVGVVGDTRSLFLRDVAEPMLYQPLLQDTWATSAVLHVRTRGDAVQFQDRARSQIRAIDPKLPVYDVTTLDARRGRAVERDRMMAALAGFFGVEALLLTAIGLYGVIAYAVGRRTAEIGVRMALGATTGRVQWMIIRDTLTLLALGTGIGLPLAFASVGVLKTSLFGVTTSDPITAVACATVLLLAGGLAGYVPARRAASVSPTLALRSE